MSQADFRAVIRRVLVDRVVAQVAGRESRRLVKVVKTRGRKLALDPGHGGGSSEFLWHSKKGVEPLYTDHTLPGGVGGGGGAGGRGAKPAKHADAPDPPPGDL